MAEIIQQIIVSVKYILQNLQDFLNPFLQRLDPALFQNIVLGVLAIFIPFAIVFLTDILNSKNKKRSEFEKMVLSDEVFGTKKIFWLSIISIVFFAFFSGVDTSTPSKIMAIIVAIILISLFWKPFKKILRFSEGYKSEFEISFLKKLSFSKIFNFKNKVKAEKIFQSWNSFWSEKSKINEKDFTNIFISHIDDAIKFRKFDLAVRLAEVYTNNIEKRDRFSIGDEILPKVFEWSEFFWDKQQLLLKKHDTEERIQKFFSKKYFSTFRDWILKIYKKLNSESERCQNWYYFNEEFFQAIIKTLLKYKHGPDQLFSSFKKHIEKSEKKLDKMTDEKEKEKYHFYIKKLFASFCPIFFNEIGKIPSSYKIWERDFPHEWKIATFNKDNRIVYVILDEFLKWSEDRIFKKESKEKLDKDLTGVINGIFPNVHSSLFTAFLMLFSSGEVKHALEKKPNFYMSMRAKNISQKEETIQIILKFFHSWQSLTVLEKIKAEINNEEIKNFCKSSKRKELYRKDFLELIELLILEIEK